VLFCVLPEYLTKVEGRQRADRLWTCAWCHHKSLITTHNCIPWGQLECGHVPRPFLLNCEGSGSETISEPHHILQIPFVWLPCTTRQQNNLQVPKFISVLLNLANLPSLWNRFLYFVGTTYLVFTSVEDILSNSLIYKSAHLVFICCMNILITLCWPWYALYDCISTHNAKMK